MGSLFRSEEMTLCQLFLQSEAAYTCVAELGEVGLVQFRDLNPNVNAFQRKFVNEVRRCDEMERTLRFLEKEIKKDEIPVLDVGDNPEAPPPREMIELESTFDKLEGELREINTNTAELKKTHLELNELLHILQKTQQFFDDMQDNQWVGDQQAQLFGESRRRSGSITPGAMKLGFMTGVIVRERLPSFERMLWRVCRGNVFLRTAEIATPLEDPSTGDYIYKSVFIIFFQGDQLKTRVKKICEGFRANIYPCPDSSLDRLETIGQVGTRIKDLNTVLSQTTDHRRRVLVAAAKNIKNWFVKIRKMKAIYINLNKFNLDVTQKCFIAECWCAISDLDRIHMALRRGTDRSGSSVPSILNRMDTKQEPPTFNRTNRFTSGFQNIVDAYGVANYQEVNPAPFTIITFPFLFAVMFGDAGHGLIMFLFALFLVVREKRIIALKSNNEIFLIFFNGRYIILLMGLFSIYTGLLYNDVFAKSLNLFGSSFRIGNEDYGQSAKNGSSTEKIVLDPSKHYLGEPYWFGIDPIWQTSANKILFLNSYKMKLSVILGVAQMLFGTCLSFFNHAYFKKPINIFCEFIPQVVFLMSIFGYMNILIVAKWLIYHSKNSQEAPSILIILINMFMAKKDTSMYNAQPVLQTILVLLALICIPWMLVIKPVLLYREHKRSSIYQARRLTTTSNDTSLVSQGATSSSTTSVGSPQLNPAGNGSVTQNASKDAVKESPENAGNSTTIAIEPTSAAVTTADGEEKGKGHEEHEEGFELGDCIIHQAIHTIEYCLGSISHTASYLRLWALSLAHAQLSEVLWNMIMKIGLNSGSDIGGVVMWFIFAFWAILTVGVLLLMEGLSAFLHALRLHWVEFQSKFYLGAGTMFEPFSFKVILQQEETNVE